MKNKYLFLGILSLMMVILVQNVLGAITLTPTPASNGLVNKSTVAILNVTYSGTITNQSLYNLTWEARSLSTANNTFVLIRSVLNVNLSLTIINYNNQTFDSRVLEDATDYTFRVNVTWANGSAGGEGTASSTGVEVDNQAPTTPLSLSPATSTSNTDGKPTFSATVNGTTTTACTLNFVSGSGYITPQQKGYVMTHTGDSCTVTFGSITMNQILASGRYNWYVQASDGTNTTDSSTFILDVQRKSSAARAYAGQVQQQLSNIQVSQQQGQQAKSSNLVLIGAIAVVLFLIYNKSKK